MRFHHSTRRGRNRLAGNRLAYHNPTSTSRRSQLAYCRETGITFNRRLPIDPPPATAVPTTTTTNEQLINLKLPSEFKTTNISRKMAGAGSSYNDNQSTSNKQLFKQTSDHQTTQQLSLNDKLQELNLNHQTTNEHFLNSKNNKHDNENLPINQQQQQLDMDAVRELLVAQVEKKPFWSSKAAKRMELLSIEQRNVYIYELSSYRERRELEWRYESYRGGGIASSMPAFRRKLSSESQPPTTATTGYSSGTPTGTASSSALIMLENPSSFNKPKRIPMPSEMSTSSENFNLSDTLTWRRDARLTRNELLSGITAAATPTQAPLIQNLKSKSSTQSSRQQYQSKMENLTGISSTNNKSLDNDCNRQQQTPVASSVGAVGSGSSCIGSTTPLSSSYISNNNSNYNKQVPMERVMPSPEEVWSIEIPEAHKLELFKSFAYTCEFPASSFVKRCHGCSGKGRIKCATCHGIGYEVCLSCFGKGSYKSSHQNYAAPSSSSIPGITSSSGKYSSNSRSNDYYNSNSTSSAGVSGFYDNDYNSSSSKYDSKRSIGEPGGITSDSGNVLTSSWATESCHSCNGSGQKRCVNCVGRSYHHCTACLGTGQLRCFLKLIISWINHREESFVNNSDNTIPKERLRLASGFVLVEEIKDKLEPLDRQWLDGGGGGLEESNQLHQASRRLLDKQRTSHTQERLIKQRHRVTKIECYLVNYQWKKRRGHFVIYGSERKVYIAKYPFKSICNIT